MPVRKGYSPLRNRLAGDELPLSQEQFRSERVDTEATIRMGKGTARVGNEAKVWVENISAATWEGNSLAEAGDIIIAASAATGLPPNAGDVTGTTREKEHGRDAMYSTLSGWSQE